jgi:two-component system, sensor histidine kinase RpfC
MAPLRWMVGRLRGRPDSEHEMSFNRLVFSAIIVCILLAGAKSGAPDRALVSMTIFISLALAVLGHIMMFPGTSYPRRIIALLLDCGFLSWQLHLGGEQGALFYPVYLWVIFGNGFRFGLPFLAAAVPVATLSFGAVVATTPYWQKQMSLSTGLLVGLIILPAYAGTLIRKLSVATRNAEDANKAKNLFLASVSHELRTPLTAIVGMTGLLQSALLDEKQREMVETIDVASRSLQGLINSVLDLSRIEAGRMPNMPDELDLLNLLTEVRGMVESQVNAKKLRFDIHVTPRTPPFLLINRQHLYEIMVNLAGNAVKFTETGGILISVDGALPAGANTDVTLTIEVSDTGIGIAPHDQARIFEDFTQANNTIMNRYGGTGLGLAITRRRVALLGGTIDVESTLGGGSTFRVSIVTQAAINAIEPSLVNKVSVALISRNREVMVQMRASLSAIGAVVTIVEPDRFVITPLKEENGRILLVHAPDWDRMDPSLSAGSSAIVLIDETATHSLPDISTRKRCAALLSDVSSLTSLHRAISTASQLTNTRASQTPEPLSVAEKTSLPAAMRRRRVLLVDDNRVNQRVFSRILESVGHEVLLAENGEQALDILEREAARLDVVLMDFNMPELDGIETTKLFRVISSGDARLPIIGLTADASAQSDSRWRDADMDGCIIKPVEPTAFLAAIDAIARNVALPVANPIAILQEHPRFRKLAVPALDEAVITNLRRLGDSAFVSELLTDFLLDATNIIGTLTTSALEGNSTAFRDQAHALRSSAINVGAMALAELCDPWTGERGSNLKARAADFAARAQAELARTRQAIHDLDAERRAQSQT